MCIRDSHRADSGNETAFDAGIGTGFYLVEECTQISFLVRFLRISVQAFDIRKDGIDKMVILIDKKINILTGTLTLMIKIV